MELRYDQDGYDMKEAILSYGKREFQSPTRSTVPLLSWLKHEQPAIESLLQQMGMSADCGLYLEYTVGPLKGRGTASHTDLMVISADSSLAIEAKWTEPRYETVGKWLTKGTNPGNRREVVTGWLELLQEYASGELQLEKFKEKDIVYQMLHRAASACAAGNDPKLAYLLFKPLRDRRSASSEEIKADLTSLWDLLGCPTGFPFYLIEVQISPTGRYETIAELGKRDPGTPDKVKEALLRTRLFDFSEPQLWSVSD